MSSPETAVAKKDLLYGMDKWEVESAADNLIRAEEIKANPKLHKAASKLISDKLIAARAAKLEAAKASVNN